MVQENEELEGCVMVVHFACEVNVEAGFCKAIIRSSRCYLYICLCSTVYCSVASCIPPRSPYQEHYLQHTGYCNTVGSVVPAHLPGMKLPEA